MAEVLATRQQISWLDDVDENGVIINPKHELYGKSMAGKELHFPSASGSTVGSDRLVNLAIKGHAPKKIVLERRDPITIWGAIFGNILLELEGTRPKPIDISELEKKNIQEDVRELLLKASEYLEVEKFIPVVDTQIAGVSYKTIQDSGLELREHLSEKYRVRAVGSATLNPAGMDLENWKEQKIPETFAKKQERIIKAYTKLGTIPTCTCTPYLTGMVPLPSAETFLSESSVVSFVNSALGGRTNRESGLSSLLYAIAGYGPVYGLHLSENRNPEVKITVEAELKTINDFGSLGYRIGEIVNGKIPYLTGVDRQPTVDEFKALGAAAAASGSVDLYHIKGITPEARLGTISLKGLEKELSVTEKDLMETKEKLNTAGREEVELVAFGCPHASCWEIKEIAGYLSGKGVKDGIDLWVCTARATKSLADKLGYTKIIEKAGGKVYCDTCMVVAPIEDVDYKTTATNSGKAAKYLPRFCKQGVVYDDTKTIIETVTK